MSNWPGNLIRKTPVTPAGPLQNGAAPGVWSLAEAAYWTKQGLWPTAGNFLAVEDVFSTYLYTGNGTGQTITNGIDLSGKGGLIWFKRRDDAISNCLVDTARGSNKLLFSNTTQGNVTDSNVLTSFGSTGFTVGVYNESNASGGLYASWAFRKAPKFFDVVTYTGNGSSSQTIAHNLGVAPGCIIVKDTSAADSWYVYHRSMSGTPQSSAMTLNSTGAAFSSSGPWADTSPTSMQFTVGVTSNTNGNTYVAYLYAHDAASDGIIQCGSFTTDGSGLGTATLGWEPQWLLCRSIGTDNWWMVDNMRGWVTGSAYNTSDDRAFIANGSNAEFTSGQGFATSTGFVFNGALSAQHIYIAIRRGPMRTPTLGTSVFYPQTISQADTIDSTNVPFAPDLVNTFSRNGTNRTNVYMSYMFVDRLRSLGTPWSAFSTSTDGRALNSSSTAAEDSETSYVELKADSQNIQRGTGWNSSNYGNWIYYFFKRAPSFFDVVCYTGTGTTSLTNNHNLGVVPELIIVKRRSGLGDWDVYFGPVTGRNSALVINSDSGPQSATGIFGTSDPTATTFSVGTGSFLNISGSTYVAYLFASCPGVSKVGSYTGTGALQTINCGFSTGARFVLIKRTDSTGDWFVWDSARGITSGNDPYLLMNSTAAEVTSTNYVDTDTTGFKVTAAAPAALNANGGTYIFLAIS